MEHDLLVLGLHAFDNLHDDHVLVVKVLHDVAGFLLALGVAVVIALSHDAVFRCLAVLGHHDYRRGVILTWHLSKIETSKGIFRDPPNFGSDPMKG